MGWDMHGSVFRKAGSTRDVWNMLFESHYIVFFPVGAGTIFGVWNVCSIEPYLLSRVADHQSSAVTGVPVCVSQRLFSIVNLVWLLVVA